MVEEGQEDLARGFGISTIDALLYQVANKNGWTGGAHYKMSILERYIWQYYIIMNLLKILTACNHEALMVYNINLGAL